MFESDLVPMYAGLDLAAGGKDFSALVLTEVYELPTGRRAQHLTRGVVDVTAEHYVVVGAYRWPQGTDPGDVLRSTAGLLALPQFALCRLLYDATGLGAGVRSIARDLANGGAFAAGYAPVTITGGQQSERGIPKVDLVSRLSRLLHEQRLHALQTELTKQWRIELQAFQAKVTAAGNIRYEAETEAVHDDLVMATALAVAKRHAPGGPRIVDPGWFRANVLGSTEPLTSAVP